MIINDEVDIMKKICKNVYCFLDKCCVIRELEMYQRFFCILILVDVMIFKLMELYFLLFNFQDDVFLYIYKIDENWFSY